MNCSYRKQQIPHDTNFLIRSNNYRTIRIALIGSNNYHTIRIALTKKQQIPYKLFL